jgi:hypothetical protein
MATSASDLFPADDSAPPAIKKPKSTPADALFKDKPADKVAHKTATPFSQFASQAKDVAKTAAKTFLDNPEDATIYAGAALFKGAVSMLNAAGSGVASLAKLVSTSHQVDSKLPHEDQVDQRIKIFVDSQKAIQAKLEGVNKAEPAQQEKAMSDLLNLIPEGINAVGDTVYEKTGSALAGAGAVALGTLLTLSPDVASKTLSRIRETAKGSTPASKVSGAFDELVAKHAEMAEKLADHVGQVDPMTAKYMKRRIQKFTDASEKDLSLIGRNAADAAIKELEGNYDEVVKMGLDRPSPDIIRVPPRPPNNRGILPREQAATTEFFRKAKEEALQKQQMMLTIKTNDQASAAIRTSAKEGVEALKAPVLNLGHELSDMSLTPRERALKRQETAYARAQQEGIAPEHDPEPIPRRAAEVEGEAKRRDQAEARRLERESELKGTDANPKEPAVLKRQEDKAKTIMTDEEIDKLHPDDMRRIGRDMKRYDASKEGKDEGNFKSGEDPKWQDERAAQKITSIASGKYEPGSYLYEADKRAMERRYEGGKGKQISDNPYNRHVWKESGSTKPFAEWLKDQNNKGPDIVYFNSGIPITREMIDKAFNTLGRGIMKIPGIEIPKAKMERYYNSFIETFNPEAKGAPARTAGSAIAQNFFQQSWKEMQVWHEGIERRNYWLKMGKDASTKFINGFELGKRFDNPQWETARRGYASWNADIYKQDMATGFEYDQRDHYMAHLFKDNEGVTKWLQKKYGNKWADPRFIKDRTFDLYQQAVEEGKFTPKFTNPEEIMQARQVASDIAALRVDLLRDFEAKGIAVKAVKGAERPPPGFSTNSRRSPTGQRYWVREEADAIMHNAFDSKSLWQDGGVKGDFFKGFMAAKNALIPIKLGLSLFHPMHVLHIDASATLARSTKSMLGRPSVETVRDFMLNSATAYLDPLWKNPRIGDPLLKVFQGKRDFNTLSDAQKAAFKDLAEGGLVPTRPMEETSGAIRKFKDAVAARSLTAPFKLPFAVLSAISHPLFSVWIPDLKIASYLKDAKVARELNPNWTDFQRQEGFRQIARKVEARYGEMNYNSMFMNKVFKDIGVATNLSLGWNLGLLDQYVGGAIDLGRGLKSQDPMASGRWDRPVFAAYYIGSALMIGGVMHYMFTGKQPQQLIDYTHPESGELDEYGKPVRLNTMFYTREFEGLYKHMEQQGALRGLGDFVANKGSGIFEMGRTALTGVDSLGEEIRDPNGSAYKKLEQTLANTLTGLNPISVEAIKKGSGSTRSKVLDVVGFTPAGKYISETVMEGKIADNFNRFVRPKEKPFQAVQMSKDMKELRGLYTKDDPKYDTKLEEMSKTYDLDSKDIRHIEKLFNSPKEAEFDPSIWMFSKLEWAAQKPLLDQMTPEEREKYLPHISKAKRQKYQRETEP